MPKHLKPSVGQIHWFSIINSCVTVLLLTGFLATILMRVLKNDFIKYTRNDEAGRTQSCQCLVLVHLDTELSITLGASDTVFNERSHVRSQDMLIHTHRQRPL